MPVVNPMPQDEGARDIAPSGTPSQQTVKPEGEIETAKAQVAIAITVLTNQLPALGTDTDEGQDVLKALTILSKRFSGTKSENLAPAELSSIMSGLPDNYKQAMQKNPPPGASQPPMM